MYMSLRMIQKPPVIFTQYDPSGVIGRSELALALGSRKSDALPWLWLSYGHSVLAEMDPCMEANEGAAATADLLSAYPMHSRIDVKAMPEGYYELKAGEACLFLAFFFPRRKLEMCSSISSLRRNSATAVTNTG